MMNAAGFVIIPLTEQDIGTWVRQNRLYPICKEAEAGLKNNKYTDNDFSKEIISVFFGILQSRNLSEAFRTGVRIEGWVINV